MAAATLPLCASSLVGGVIVPAWRFEDINSPQLLFEEIIELELKELKSSTAADDVYKLAPLVRNRCQADGVW